MNPATILSAGTLIVFALFLTGAVTANTRPGEPLWPTADHRANLGLSLLGLACAFCAGLLL